MGEKVILDFDNTMGLRDHEVDDGLVLLYLLGRQIGRASCRERV